MSGVKMINAETIGKYKELPCLEFEH